MSSTTRMAMGFENHHLVAGSGTECSTTETTDTAADHDHLTLGGHGVIRSVTGQFIAGRS